MFSLNKPNKKIPIIYTNLSNRPKNTLEYLDESNNNLLLLNNLTCNRMNSEEKLKSLFDSPQLGANIKSTFCRLQESGIISQLTDLDIIFNHLSFKDLFIEVIKNGEEVFGHKPLTRLLSEIDLLTNGEYTIKPIPSLIYTSEQIYLELQSDLTLNKYWKKYSNWWLDNYNKIKLRIKPIHISNGFNGYPIWNGDNNDSSKKMFYNQKIKAIQYLLGKDEQIYGEGRIIVLTIFHSIVVESLVLANLSIRLDKDIESYNHPLAFCSDTKYLYIQNKYLKYYSDYLIFTQNTPSFTPNTLIPKCNISYGNIQVVNNNLENIQNIVLNKIFDTIYQKKIYPTRLNCNHLNIHIDNINKSPILFINIHIPNDCYHTNHILKIINDIIQKDEKIPQNIIITIDINIKDYNQIKSFIEVYKLLDYTSVIDIDTSHFINKAIYQKYLLDNHLFTFKKTKSYLQSNLNMTNILDIGVKNFILYKGPHFEINKLKIIEGSILNKTNIFSNENPSDHFPITCTLIENEFNNILDVVDIKIFIYLLIAFSIYYNYLR